MTALDWAVPLLACPMCGGVLRVELDRAEPAQGVLVHDATGCLEVYPIIDGIPRLLIGTDRPALAARRADWFAARPETGLAKRWSGPPVAEPVVRAFDDEWARFPTVRSSEFLSLFDLYFDLVPEDRMTSDGVVLDAGCGAGRWAIEAAVRGARVLAIDRGMSIELANRNAAGSDRIACIQADLRALPIRPATLSWAYSLGVLHHMEEPEKALSAIVRAVEPGGLVLLYLYYALDGRGPLFRAAFRTTDLVRRLVSRWPRAAVIPFSTAFAVLVYWPLARLSALAGAAGRRRMADAMPLSFYRDRPLWIMRNDSLDRFGTRLEVRYTREQMVRLMRSSGLRDVRFSPRPPFWHATGVV